jgi:hypothetical protein
VKINYVTRSRAARHLQYNIVLAAKATAAPYISCLFPILDALPPLTKPDDIAKTISSPIGSISSFFCGIILWSSRRATIYCTLEYGYHPIHRIRGHTPLRPTDWAKLYALYFGKLAVGQSYTGSRRSRYRATDSEDAARRPGPHVPVCRTVSCSPAIHRRFQRTCPDAGDDHDVQPCTNSQLDPRVASLIFHQPFCPLH